MSIWTHVVGSIRFDGLAGRTEPPDLGNTVDFEDDTEAWSECNVPCGSEGSLQTELWTNPDGDQLARWTATIFGDLRDYGNAENEIQDIVNYFDRITQNQMVRCGCFTVSVEGQADFVYIYAVGEKRFICVYIIEGS